MIRLVTERLILRELSEEDFGTAHAILGDTEVMYAWEHGFSEDETREWIEENVSCYRRDSAGYLAAIEKHSGALAGFIGPLIENVNGERRVGIGYILGKKFWKRGLAAEGASAAIDYAFAHIGTPDVIAEIRPQNRASRLVALRLGMKELGSFTKIYNNKEMTHIIYSITRKEWAARQA